MASEEQSGPSSADAIPGVLTISPHPDIDLKAEEEEEGVTVGSGGLLSSQAYLVSPSLSNPTLQSLLTSPTALHGAQLGLPEGIQIVTVSNPTDILPSSADLAAGKIWHIINPETICQQAIIAVGDVDGKSSTYIAGESLDESDAVSGRELMEGHLTDVTSLLMPPPQPQQPLPPGCPAWAARLNNCQKIGDYYRGYVENEIDLDILLTYHKQATQTFWGTRQSPSPAKQSTRFMWKSQYVPWDGVPFVNTGSRAVVMECQYGPRRKGSIFKKQGEVSSEYKQTCPARIYIKKVRKFPEYRIDPNLIDMRDKKNLKNAMDKAFHDLKMQNIEKLGQDRFYVQLPLCTAHEFHDDIAGKAAAVQLTQPVIIPDSPPLHVAAPVEPPELIDLDKKCRLNPQVVQKIREIVAGGEVRVYHVRRLLRMYVCRYLCNGITDTQVQRHDLTLFPTVTDLKNQIHQAVKDIENGTLALTAPTVNVEPVSNSGSEDGVQLNVWPQNLVSSGPVPETVTVTLTQSPGEDGGHVISRIETHLSDGTTQISTSLTPETAQLLARLNPSMFPPGSLVHLQASGDADTPAESDAAILDDHTNIEAVNSFSGMNIETTDTMDQCAGPLTIQASHSDAVSIATMQHSPNTSALLTAEAGSLGEPGSDLINVSMVTAVQNNMEEMQTDSCDDDL